MDKLNVLTQRLRVAAGYLETHGWIQNTERDDSGCVCLTGAVRYCAPQTGDEWIIREVLRRRDRAENWNDRDGRTEGDVLNVLRTAEVTDVDLREIFGPQWREIVTLVRQAAALTEERAEQLYSAWISSLARNAARNAAREAAREAARGVVREVAREAARGVVREVAWGVVREVAQDHARSVVRDAAREAAEALVVRDRINEDHFNRLYGPWASVFGEPVPCEL